MEGTLSRSRLESTTSKCFLVRRDFAAPKFYTHCIWILRGYLRSLTWLNSTFENPYQNLLRNHFFQKKSSMSKCKKSTSLQDSRFKSIFSIYIYIHFHHNQPTKSLPSHPPPRSLTPTSSKRWHWYTMASIRSFRACVKEVKDRKGTSAASKVKGCKTTWRSLGVIGGWGGFPPGGSKNTGRCFNNPFFLGGG